MASLSDEFAAYYAPNSDMIAAALRTGLVAPDTNVLLAAYRFERQARDELLSAFEKLEDRLWIPHQVALEFHRNRLSVIAAQESFFNKARDDLESAVNSYLEKLRAFANRIAIPQSRSQELERMVQAAHIQVAAQVTNAEEANDIHINSRDSDQVLTRLEIIFHGRVGGPMPPDQLDAAIKEARRRIDHKIPPGYADKGKSDPSGDYLVWRQLLDEARVRRLPVVLVTDDQKEDWVRREHGLALGPRPEMYQEMAEATGTHFCLMSTATFLRHAKDYLSVSVSPETVDQAQELPGALVVRERARDEEILQLQIIEMEAEINSFTEQLQRLRQEAYDAQMNVRALQRLSVTNSSGEPLDEEKLKELGDALTQGQAVKVRLDSQIYNMVSGLRALETRRKNLRAKIRAMSEEITTES